MKHQVKENKEKANILSNSKAIALYVSYHLP